MPRRAMPAGLLIAALVVAPLALSPAQAEPIGEPTRISTFDPARTSDACASVSVAVNPVSGSRLATWIAPNPASPSDGVVETVLLDASGAPIGEPVPVSSTLPSSGWDYCQPVSVAAGGDGGFLVLWPNRDDNSIYGQVVSSAGALVGENLAISSSTGYGDIETVTAAWSPESERYLATWKANTREVFAEPMYSQQIIGRFVSASGAGIGDDFLVTATPEEINNSQAVSYGNGRWVVVGVQDSNDLAVAQVVTTSGPQGAPQLLDDQSRGGAGVSVTFNPSTGQFLATYRSSSLVLGRLLDSSGLVTGTAFTVAESGGARPRVAAAGENGYLVVWHSNSRVVTGQALDSDGAVQGDPTAIHAGGNGFRPEVAYSAVDGRFIVVWMWNPGTPNETNAYSRTWFVVDPAVEPPLEPEPELTAAVAETDLAPGDSTTVSGSGATPGGTVTVSFAGGRELASVVADADGDYSATVTIPKEAPAGANFLRVLDVESGSTVDIPITIAAILAATGAELGLAMPLAALVLILGAGMLVVGRPKAARH